MSEKPNIVQLCTTESVKGFLALVNSKNTHRADTWCASTSVSGPAAPLLDGGTVRLWGWWWALQATAQTSGQRNSAGRGQRPGPGTCEKNTLTSCVDTVVHVKEKGRKTKGQAITREQVYGKDNTLQNINFLWCIVYLRLSIQSPSSSSRVPCGCRLWRTGIRPPSVCRWPQR